MKTITQTAIVFALALAMSSSFASAQVGGSGGGEGTGSSRHFETLGVNPQNIGINANTASATTTGAPIALIAIVVGVVCGGGAYLALNKAFARAEA